MVAPEETMPAFSSAVDLGADVLEMDLHATADGVIVLMHDAEVDRTTDGTGYITDMTFDELRGLDAGYRFSPDGESFPFRGQGLVVTSFEEVLGAFPEMYFAAEIKQANPSIVEGVLEVLWASGAQDRIVMASGFDSVVASIRSEAPNVKTSLGGGEMFSLATMNEEGLNAYQPPAGFIQPPADIMDVDMLARFSRFGLKVHVWTVNKPDDMRRLIELGVDGIMTDDPAALEVVIDEMGLER